MYRHFFGIALLLWASVASAVVIEFRAEWDVVPDVDDYALYVCDAPIQQQFSDPISDTPIVTQCSSTLFTYVRKGTATTDSYRTKDNDGTLYFRVSSRKLMQVGDEVLAVESELSDQVEMRFKSIDKPTKPVNLRVEGPLSVPVKEKPTN
jgi:hypothetical protein